MAAGQGRGTDRNQGGNEPKADSEAASSGLVARSIDEFVNQLRGFTDKARSIAGAVPGRLSLPALPSPPGAMSAAQLRAVAATVSAQRQSIAAMASQLEAFDQQLAVVEKVLAPLVEWSSTWARLEEAIGDLVRRDGTDGQAAGH
jgi:hypothetical protein